MFKRPLSVAVAICVSACAGAWLSHAGPLDPPAGPVASSFKTLGEVEPRLAVNSANTPGDVTSLFKITKPGSYYLTGNITGVAGKHGIAIVSSGVTLDLNGFDLVGTPGMGSFDGITVSVDNLVNITVVNGSVRNWGDEGVDLFSFFAADCRVEGVVSSGNSGSGISTGASSTVARCSSSLNGGQGIAIGTGSVVTGCAVSNNTAGGISASSGSRVVGCSAQQNFGNGITAGNGCTVLDSNARSNTFDGILCTNNCLVIQCDCSFNGTGGDGAGIHANGSDNRIERNMCTSADRGIDVDAAGNLVIKNSCSGNTLNWDVAAGNVILVVNATAAGAFSGNAGGAAPGSTDPNANFTY